MQRRARRRGATSVEQVSVVLCIAMVGLGGMRAVGVSFRNAIGSDGKGGLWAMLTSSQAAEGAVCATGPQVPGIDVSHHQDTINWDQVKGSGVQYAFVRVSDGVRNPDNQFERNWAEAKRVGIMRGAYQYFRPGEDPIAQAKLFVERVGRMDANDLPPVLDLEGGGNEHVPGQQVVEGALRWVDYVEKALGKRPIIYTGHYYWEDTVAGSDVFMDFPLWVPNYSKACPLVPDPWNKWTFFQHAADGTVPGIGGGVDMNLFNGDLVALSDFAKDANIAAPAEPAAAPTEAVVAPKKTPTMDTSKRAVLALRNRIALGGRAGTELDRGLTMVDLRRGLTRSPRVWLSSAADGFREMADLPEFVASVSDSVNDTARNIAKATISGEPSELVNEAPSQEPTPTIVTPANEYESLETDTNIAVGDGAGMRPRVTVTKPAIGVSTGVPERFVTQTRVNLPDVNRDLRATALPNAANVAAAQP